MEATAEQTDYLSMSDEDFLKMEMPAFEQASFVEGEGDTEEVNVEEEVVQPQVKEPVEEVAEEAVEATQEEVVDNTAEAQLAKLFGTFKANGKEMKVNNVDEAIRLMQQGANYNKKMAGLKPSMKMLKMLENNGLLDESKISYLIDLDKKNPQAITKLLKDSGIDPLDVDVGNASKYTPSNYAPSDSQMKLDDVLHSIEDTPTFQRTMGVLLDEWDDASKRVLAADPALIPLINEHMANGIFDQITSELTRQKALGNLNGVSDLQAYEHIGKHLAAQGAFHKPPNQPVEVRAKVPKQESADVAAKRKAASPTKVSNSDSKPANNFNPLAMSDEEFEKEFNSRFR